MVFGGGFRLDKALDVSIDRLGTSSQGSKPVPSAHLCTNAFTPARLFPNTVGSIDIFFLPGIEEIIQGMGQPSDARSAEIGGLLSMIGAPARELRMWVVRPQKAEVVQACISVMLIFLVLNKWTEMVIHECVDSGGAGLKRR